MRDYAASEILGGGVVGENIGTGVGRTNAGRGEFERCTNDGRGGELTLKTVETEEEVRWENVLVLEYLIEGHHQGM